MSAHAHVLTWRKRKVGTTHIVSLNVWDFQFFGEVLRNGALATASGACDDPHVAMVMMRGESRVDLLDRVRRGVVHLRGCGEVVPSVDANHGHRERGKTDADVDADGVVSVSVREAGRLD